MVALLQTIKARVKFQVLDKSLNQISDREEGSSTSEKENGIKLVASEKKLPSNLHKIAIQREEVPYFNYFVKRVHNQTQYEEVWELFNLEQQLPKIDFEVNDIYFIGLQESGSCPFEPEDVKISINNEVMKIHLSQPEGGCTSDATARTFVIEVNKESSSDVKNIMINESAVETTLPIIDLE